jgi:hypothetical protein
MGKLIFGNDEKLTCIQPVAVKGSEGEALCLAYKTSKIFFGAGVYLRDQGYVLAVTPDAKRFYELSAARTEELQAKSLLPRPLPAYSIPWYEYAWGYSLWIILAALVAGWAVMGALRKRRQAEDAATPTSFGPPTLTTAADRFVDEQARRLLEAGEVVQHQAYTLTQVPTGSIADAMGSARYVVLTDRRVFLFSARVGAFGPLLESTQEEILERRRIARVAVDDRALTLTLDDGSLRVLFVAPTKKLSNQRAFLRDVPRILGGVAPAVAGAASIA